MTAAELLKPRFEVVADYPNCPFKVGSILQRIENATNNWFGIDNCVLNTILLDDIQKYPHIFKPLKWWEHRKVEDMPKKVIYKYRENPNQSYDIMKWESNITGIIQEKPSLVTCTMFSSINKEFGYFPID